MSKDNWNIKDKEIDCSDIIGLNKIVDTKDIEILRKKLIEDLKRIFDFLPYKDIEDIVNKRFGVK